jgi:hypothetical protein
MLADHPFGRLEDVLGRIRSPGSKAIVSKRSQMSDAEPV